MKRIYNCTSLAHEDEDDQRDHHFVSLDGEYWLEMDREATAEDYDQIAEHFSVKVEGEHRIGNITLATRYIRCWCREPKFHEPMEVAE